MSYTYEKSTGDLVISGWEKGIAPSPHFGIANMQAVNISTETGEVMCNFNRTAQQQTSITGTFTVLNASPYITLSSSTSGLKAGSWITMTSSGITGLTNGTSYYVLDGTPGFIALSATYSQNISSAISFAGHVGETATFTTANYLVNVPLASATEIYIATDLTTQYRYYILDNSGFIWVHDSYSSGFTSIPNPLWFLPDKTAQSGASGIAILNGYLFVFSNSIKAKNTIDLGKSFTTFSGGTTLSFGSNNKHFAFVGHQGKLYYTDGCYIGSIFPNSSLLSGLSNIQSFASYTATGATGTISIAISGSLPTTGITGSTLRIPVYFFAGSGGNVASSLTEGTVYYIQTTGAGTFQVYSAITGGSAIADIATGAVGTQYLNTFYPFSSDGLLTLTFTPQRLNLPIFEKSQCISEIGNNILIGCNGNIVYPWNQIDPLPGDIISLPENNVSSIINVNNMGYIFAGNKGNIYITNGSSASGVLTVPDYCAGIAGTQKSYIEPYFTWGGTMYLRGRVYFSILDQTSTKAGNCGGIWSFVPTQNIFFGQNEGISLRLENQSSYGTYSGYSTILLPSQTQTAISPQYWSGWQSDSAGVSYGIDFTSTTTGTTAIIETDLIPSGTMLNKKTFQQIEYKLASPLAVGESVAISYRKNGTEAYTSCGTAIVESTTGLSGYFTANFENTQWLQLKITLTPLSTSSSTFVRLTEIRIR